MPGCALLRVMIDVIRKMTASTGNAYRSKAWTRLCPKNATATWISTTMIRQSRSGSLVRVASASAPETLFTANQPMPATTALRPAGRMLPR